MFPRRMLYALSVVALILTAFSMSFLKAQPRRGKPIHVRGFIIAQLAGQQTLAIASPKTRLSLALPNVFVHLEDISSGQTNPVDVTDLSGRFHLTVFQEGRYRLCWKADGFQPGCKVVSLANNTYVGNIPIDPQKADNTTTLFGHVQFRDGSGTRTIEPYMNINAFAQVEFADVGGKNHLAYVNNFHEYVLPLFPTRAPVKLVAAIEKGRIIQEIDPKTGMSGALQLLDLRIDNIPPKLAPLVPADNTGKHLQLIKPGTKVFLKARVNDLDKDPVQVLWFADEGSGQLSAKSGLDTVWDVPNRPGMYRVTAMAYDGKGGYSKQDLALQVRDGGVRFTGTVAGTDKPVVVGAEVNVNGLIAVTNQYGAFKLEVPEAGRYVLNVHKSGYAENSKIYDRGIAGGKWTLVRASVSTVDPKQPIKLVNKRIPSDCPGPLTGKIDWQRFAPLLQARWQDGRGNDISPPPVKGGDKRLVNTSLATRAPAGTVIPVMGRPGKSRECGPGIAIEIPANALVDDHGNPPTGNVSIAMSTVDLSSPEQMPGDYSVVMPDKSTKVMQSYGAGSVEITAGGKRYNLKSGVTAKVAIPVDPMQIQAGGALPPSIPLLHYDDQMGAWRQDGLLSLVTTPSPAYVATVKHFSYVNSDLVKVGQACIAVRSDSTMPSSYTIEVTVPPKVAGQAPDFKTGTFNTSAPHEDVILNLPTNTNIVLVPIINGTKPDGSSGPIPAGVFVVNSGGPQIGPVVPGFPANLPVGPPYYTESGGVPAGPCSAVVTLTQQSLPDHPSAPEADEFLQGLSFRATNLTELNPANPGDNNLITAIHDASNAYYNQVDPRQLRRDLTDFLSRNGFPSPSETIAYYANSGDLGFGREMHCLKRPASDGQNDIACYVTNYGDYTTPDQDDANNAAATNGPIATVAMEFTRIENAPGDPNEFAPGAQRSVKFYVYKVAKASTIHIGQGNGIDVSANLDGKGERPVPQLCIVCHGGTYTQTELTAGDPTTRTPVFTTPGSGDVSAHFLPFDLRYYTFPNTSPTLIESAQGPAFRTLNIEYVRQAFNGTPPTTHPIVELIDKWYTATPTDPQNKEAIINGWKVASATTPQPATQEFYHTVFGHTCRTCHITSPFGTFQFQNGSDFTNIIADVQQRVCSQHVMPHAKRAHDLFWTSVSPSMPGILQVYGQTLPGFDATDPNAQCGLSFTPAGPPAVSVFSTQIQPIFNSRCTSCHATATSFNSNLNLSSGSSFANLVGVNSFESPTHKRVLASDHLNSYLWRKVDGTSSVLLPPGHPVNYESQMPLGGPAITGTQKTAIQNWIDGGANP